MPAIGWKRRLVTHPAAAASVRMTVWTVVAVLLLVTAGTHPRVRETIAFYRWRWAENDAIRARRFAALKRLTRDPRRRQTYRRLRDHDRLERFRQALLRDGGYCQTPAAARRFAALDAEMVRRGTGRIGDMTFDLRACQAYDEKRALISSKGFQVFYDFALGKDGNWEVVRAGPSPIIFTVPTVDDAAIMKEIEKHSRLGGLYRAGAERQTAARPHQERTEADGVIWFLLTRSFYAQKFPCRHGCHYPFVSAHVRVVLPRTMETMPAMWHAGI